MRRGPAHTRLPWLATCLLRLVVETEYRVLTIYTHLMQQAILTFPSCLLLIPLSLLPLLILPLLPLLKIITFISRSIEFIVSSEAESESAFQARTSQHSCSLYLSSQSPSFYASTFSHALQQVFFSRQFFPTSHTVHPSHNQPHQPKFQPCKPHRSTPFQVLSHPSSYLSSLLSAHLSTPHSRSKSRTKSCPESRLSTTESHTCITRHSTHDLPSPPTRFTGERTTSLFGCEWLRDFHKWCEQSRRSSEGKYHAEKRAREGGGGGEQGIGAIWRERIGNRSGVIYLTHYYIRDPDATAKTSTVLHPSPLRRH